MKFTEIYEKFNLNTQQKFDQKIVSKKLCPIDESCSSWPNGILSEKVTK